MKHKPVGKHVLMDFRGCKNHEILKDSISLERLIEENIHLTKSRIVKTMGHWFDNEMYEAYTLLSVISESHAAFHTYPEYNAVFGEIFTCGETDPEYILKPLLYAFQPESGTITLKWRYLDESFKIDLSETFDLNYIKRVLKEYSMNQIEMTKYDEESIVFHFKKKKE